MIVSKIVRAPQHAAGAWNSTKKRMHRVLEGRSKHKNATFLRCVGQSDQLSSDTGTGARFARRGCTVTQTVEHLWALLADNTYDAEKRVRAVLEKAGVEAVIAPKAYRKEPHRYDEHLYQAQALVENVFAKLKQFRAIVTRYDKTAVAFLGVVHLAAITV